MERPIEPSLKLGAGEEGGLADSEWGVEESRKAQT